MADREVRRRFRRALRRHPRPRRSPARRDQRRVGDHGTGLLGGQDQGGAHVRGIRFPGLPHPVETQTRNEHLARLHLHRRPADPVAEGENTCPDEQDVTAVPGVRADQTGSHHARMVHLLPARRQQAHLLGPGHVRVASGGPVADGAASLEVEGVPPTIHRPRAAGGDHCRRTGKPCSTSKRSRSPGTATERTSRPPGR